MVKQFRIAFFVGHVLTCRLEASGICEPFHQTERHLVGISLLTNSQYS